MRHTFHIPVLGLAFSIDSPIKVARYGISSVISIVDDMLIERMRAYYSQLNNRPYETISSENDDHRAERITGYLNLVNDLVNDQIDELKAANFDESPDLHKYFELLPDSSAAKKRYQHYLSLSNQSEKAALAKELKSYIVAGDIDVNIMSKVDKANVDAKGNPLPSNYTDACAALRGFAKSNLNSSLVISAGLNPRLFTYLGEFDHFLPDQKGHFNKKITLKVSDYRSALIQAKILAKKGIWVSEFKVESGLNCGGHAFATEGLLLGPILEEFREKRQELQNELFTLYNDVLKSKNRELKHAPAIQITVQGGIGTAHEQNFILEHYAVDRTGWGSPFLLVPEATTVDEATLQRLMNAGEEDFYISDASPLGVPFNNFRNSSAEAERLSRIAKGRPGAPCTKKYLVTNKEFTEEMSCTASRVYQHFKLKQINEADLSQEEKDLKTEQVISKACLCEGLATSAYLKYDILNKKESKAVAICPGPNTKYFNNKYSLKDMVDHIYGRQNLLEHINRPSIFINELQLYLSYLKKYIQSNSEHLDNQKNKYIDSFKNNISSAITYYGNLKEKLFSSNQQEKSDFTTHLNQAANLLRQIEIDLKSNMKTEEAI